ncbi:hypothetical protein FB451DRAFT_1190951 [Mycena latifolia]|nr:hypothetical protein FB451DRAFT_1190951 [Mycena latifolia]
MQVGSILIEVSNPDAVFQVLVLTTADPGHLQVHSWTALGGAKQPLFSAAIKVNLSMGKYIEAIIFVLIAVLELNSTGVIWGCRLAIFMLRKEASSMEMCSEVIAIGEASGWRCNSGQRGEKMGGLETLSQRPHTRQMEANIGVKERNVVQENGKLNEDSPTRRAGCGTSTCTSKDKQTKEKASQKIERRGSRRILTQTPPEKDSRARRQQKHHETPEGASAGVDSDVESKIQLIATTRAPKRNSSRGLIQEKAEEDLDDRRKRHRRNDGRSLPLGNEESGPEMRAEHEHPRAESVREYSAHNICKRTVRRNRWQRRSRLSETVWRLKEARKRSRKRPRKHHRENTERDTIQTISDGQEEKIGTDGRFWRSAVEDIHRTSCFRALARTPQGFV